MLAGISKRGEGVSGVKERWVLIIGGHAAAMGS